jgi:hypothetical protein
MLTFGISQSLYLEMRQALELGGGLTESIFPEAEAWFRTSADRMKSFEYVASRKKMDRYESVIDFLFCEIFTRYRRSCFNFYERKGPQLKDMITIPERSHFALVLVKALDLGYQAFAEKRRLSWTELRVLAIRAAA